jgi:hypothetical protein
MECNNKYCAWNAFDQCCPEDEDQFNNAVPNALDCPSSLRVDFQEQLTTLANECRHLLNSRSMKELIQIKKYIELQRDINMEDKIREVLASHFGLSDEWQDGTYLYHLTRVKSAFGFGTMTLDDFVEVDEEFLEEVVESVMKVLVE